MKASEIAFSPTSSNWTPLFKFLQYFRVSDFLPQNSLPQLHSGHSFLSSVDRQFLSISKWLVPWKLPHTPLNRWEGGCLWSLWDPGSKHSAVMHKVRTSGTWGGIPPALGHWPAQLYTCWRPGRASPGQRCSPTRRLRAPLIGQVSGPPLLRRLPEKTRRGSSRGPSPGGASPVAAPTPPGRRLRPGAWGGGHRAEEEAAVGAGGLRGAGRRPEARGAFLGTTPLTAQWQVAWGGRHVQGPRLSSRVSLPSRGARFTSG